MTRMTLEREREVRACAPNIKNWSAGYATAVAAMLRDVLDELDATRNKLRQAQQVRCYSCMEVEASLGRAQARIAALEQVLASCASKLRQMGREFSSAHFTDRYGDGPVMLQLAKQADEILFKAQADARGREEER